ncbi:MAG: FAD-binding oxidoreductase [Mariprofundaceae bacterium]|nr:FAD-binding oxidoreductase [Mariprofundaceae bacterium]
MQHPSLFRMKLKEKKLLTDPDCDHPVMQLTLVPVLKELLHDFDHGQCVRIGVPHAKKPTPAYFAIASSPEDAGHYDFVVKQNRGIANYLCQMSEGEEVEVDGPMGKGFNLADLQGKNVILIGVGTGIAPLRSVWRSIINHRNDFKRVSIYAGFLTQLHRLLVDETLDLNKHGIDVHTTFTREHTNWNGPIGYVQDALKDLSPCPENTVVCLAGMTAMIEGCTDILHRLGFSDDQIVLNF